MTPEELAQLKKENELLKEENQKLKQAAPKERLYDKLPVTLKMMNYIVAALFVLLAVVMLIALLDR